MISLIIPVSNDVTRLRRTLRSLVPEKDGHEIVVVDAGSRDGSAELARSLKWVRLLKEQGTVASRVNAAATRVKGDTVLILPPGIILERGWSAAVEEASTTPGFALGAFRAAYDGRSPVYRLSETVAWLRTRLFGLPREEQAMFFRREQLLNGRVYLDLEAARDFNLARRLRREGGFTLLPLAAVSPAPPLQRLPAGCACKTATFWSFVLNRPLGAIDRCEKEREPMVVVLVDAPEPARAPAWMRRELGEGRAADVYARCVDNVLRAALDAAPGRVLGFYRPSRCRDEVVARWGSEVHWIPQGGRGKAERYLGALKEAVASTHRPVILLDPLFPGLTPEIIRKAICGLRREDAVIGPNGRGGCYLAGLRAQHFARLENLSWEPGTREDELVGAFMAGRASSRRLAPLRTLDSVEDLVYYWARGWMANGDPV